MMSRRPLIHLFIALLALGAAGALYAFWYHEVSKDTKHSIELQSQIEATERSAASATETGNALVALANDEVAIESYRIKLAEIVPFLERIEGTGRALGSSVEVVAVSDKPGSDGRIALTLRILGSFDTVLRTLGALEYGPYDSRITSLTFDTPQTGGAWTAAVSLSLAVDTQ